MHEKLFTVEEANALIPTLEILMSKLQRQGLLFREQVQELARQTGLGLEELTTGRILDLRPHLRPVVEDLEALLAEIESHGVEMKGLDLGLIDFPAEINDELVLLCWQYGEKEVAYYHGFEAGFAGRQPLNPERPKYLQ